MDNVAPSTEPTPKKAIVKPRHRAVLKHMVENQTTITAAMIAQSYSPNTVETPALVTNTKSWRALMDEFLPQDKLAMRHQELLDKRETEVRFLGGPGRKAKYEVIDKGPDTTAVGKGLEMAYKLRGSYAPEASAPPPTTIYQLFYKPEVRASVAVFEEQLKASLASAIATDIYASTDVPQEPTAAEEADGGDTGEPVTGSVA